MSYKSPKWNNGSAPPLSAENMQALTDAVQEQGEALETMCNPNLLDNWYFGNPVNQRGQTNYTGTGYGIDRWKLDVGESVTIDNGLNLVKANSYIGQYFDDFDKFVGRQLVGSVLMSDGNLYTGTYIYNGILNQGQILFANSIMGMYIQKLASALTQVEFNTAIDNVKVLAVKLELGSQQTLAHQKNGVWVLNEIPDYGEQLRRCQRYYIRYSAAGQAVLFTGIVRNNADVRAVLTGLNMRTAPVVGYGGNMRAYIPGGSPVVVKTVTRDLLTKNGGSLDITTNTSSEFTAGLGVIISAANNDTTSESYIDLSADL